MQKMTPWVIGLLVLGGAVVVWWYFSINREPTPEPVGTVAGENERFADSSKDGAAEGVKSVTIGYTDTGFTPKTITIQAGTKVTFVNQSSGEMWVASDEHPSHTQYSGTSRDSHCPDPGGVAFDQCGTGSSYSFVFTKTGTWEYHNHRNAGMKGAIVVE